jgi:2Fe-2S ferredoxin
MTMPKVTYISHTGETTTIDVPVGTSVMEGAVKNGIDGIVAECGGACMCATCHVYVDPAFLERLPAIGEEQEEMLGATAAERKPNSRLSCQIEMKTEYEGLIVRMPERQT